MSLYSDKARASSTSSSSSDASGGIFAKLVNADAFPKLREDYRVRTTSGGTVSLISLVVMVFLVVYEFGDYLYPPTNDTLMVDTDTSQKMKINFDFTFPNLACAVVNMEAMDVSGKKQEDVEHNVFKRRLDKRGKQIGYHEKHELGGTVKDVEELMATPENEDGEDGGGEGGDAAEREKTKKKNAAKNGKDKCGSCYGAESDDLKCCNTCDDVREAYRKKGWSFAVRNNIKQCSQEGFVDSVEAQRGEGCKVYGYIEVPKVGGNFHFAPGQGFRHARMTVADLFGFTLKKWNVSHTINELSFGDSVPGKKNPLDRTVKSLHEGTGMYQYYAKVVPTDYVYRDGSVLATNQYSVTDHFQRIVSANARGLPGIYVFYDLSPIKVRIVEDGSRLAGFLTSVCAIVGGACVVLLNMCVCVCVCWSATVSA